MNQGSVDDRRRPVEEIRKVGLRREDVPHRRRWRDEVREIAARAR